MVLFGALPRELKKRAPPPPWPPPESDEGLKPIFTALAPRLERQKRTGVESDGIGHVGGGEDGKKGDCSGERRKFLSLPLSSFVANGHSPVGLRPADIRLLMTPLPKLLSIFLVL